MADGVDTITDWSVVPGYGSEMMAPDDKVVFWVSGDSRVMIRGIWGIGHVADYAQDSVPDDFQMGDINYWKDEEAGQAWPPTAAGVLGSFPSRTTKRGE